MQAQYDPDSRRSTTRTPYWVDCAEGGRIPSPERGDEVRELPVRRSASSGGRGRRREMRGEALVDRSLKEGSVDPCGRHWDRRGGARPAAGGRAPPGGRPRHGGMGRGSSRPATVPRARAADRGGRSSRHRVGNRNAMEEQVVVTDAGPILHLHCVGASQWAPSRGTDHCGRHGLEGDRASRARCIGGSPLGTGRRPGRHVG